MIVGVSMMGSDIVCKNRFKSGGWFLAVEVAGYD